MSWQVLALAKFGQFFLQVSQSAHASPGPFFKIRFVPRTCIIWLKQVIRQTQRRISKASELQSLEREEGGRRGRHCGSCLALWQQQVLRMGRTRPVGGWIDLSLFACTSIIASITVAREGNISGIQDSLLCPYPQFTSRPYCNCLHFGMVHSILVAAEFV